MRYEGIPRFLTNRAIKERWALSVVQTHGKHFLAALPTHHPPSPFRLHQEGVLQLRRVAADLVAERRVVLHLTPASRAHLHNASLHEAVQRVNALRLAALVAVHREGPAVGTVQPAPAEGQRVEGAQNVLQQPLVLRAHGRVLRRGVERVVTGHAARVRVARAGGGEGLDGEDVARLHALGRVLEHQRDALVAVDGALHQVVARQVADRHDYASVSRAAATGVRVAVDRHLVRVDHLLDHAAQLAQVRVHARRLDRRVGGVARGGDQRLELRVEREGERAVDDVA